MKENDAFRRDYIHENDLFRQGDAEDLELAFQLQATDQVDRDILERIIRYYGHNLYKWIGILLFYQNEIPPGQDKIISAMQDVFVKAIQSVDQFHGQTSIAEWLFKVSYPIVKRHRGKTYPALDHSNPIGDQVEGNVVIHTNTTENSIFVDHFPEKLRSPLLLRYMFGFGIHEIAAILNLQIGEVHRRLKQARARILGKTPKTHMDNEIQAHIDGMLEGKPQELERLQQHLMQCDLCREYADRLSELDQTLRDELDGQWLFPSLEERIPSNLADQILNQSRQSTVQKKVLSPIRYTTWFAGLAVLFIGMAFIFIKLTPTEREFPQASLTPTPQLPPVVKIPSARSSLGDNKEYIDAPQYIDPAFSGDGNWAVFASIKSDPTTQAVILPTIELYSRETGSLQTISESTAQLRLPWIWWDLAPGISGDGRRIVYVSASTDTNTIGDACATADHRACLDIFLYERDTGETRRLTQSIDGGAANGDSLAPTISEDGNSVAFWSAANNLVDGVNDTCQRSESTITCMYIYIYNLRSGTIEWLPVRNAPGDVFGVDRISLSGDGRYVGFTATSLGQSGIYLPGNQAMINLAKDVKARTDPAIPMSFHDREAVVYDRATQTYELENLTEDGSLGDGASSSPVLSADGQYVAFSSASTNLVQGDINLVSDVFLRDRHSGKIEIISVSSDGRQGTENSGMSFWGRGYYSISLSNDGRYVAFESTADNLGKETTSACSHSRSNVCYVLYVRDRQTGLTEEISALPNGDFSFFPSISNDGRWVAFMQSFYNCSAEQFFCSNVMLYDRQSDLLTNLTRYNLDISALPWTYSGSLALPWETWESTALAFSPDGTLLALGGYDSKVRIWQISAEGIIDDKAKPDTLLSAQRHNLFTTLAFSRDGDWLAAGTASSDVYIWKLGDGRPIYTLDVLSDPIKKIVYSQDGARIVISTLNETWIINKGDRELTKGNVILYGTDNVYAVEVSQAGNMLATVREDDTVWIQSLPDGKLIGQLDADGVRISSLAFSEDGTLLVTRSSTGITNLWHIGATETQFADITLMNTFRTRGYVGTITFSVNNRYIISTGRVGEITLWSVPDGKIYTLENSSPGGMVYSVAFNKSSHKMAVVLEDRILLWRIPRGSSACHRSSPLQGIYGNPE